MKTVIAIMKFINFLTTITAKAVSYACLLLILALCYEVIARYVFGAPTTWSFDATYFLCSIAMVLTLAYTWQQNAHVSVDMILAKFSIKVQALLNVIFLLIIFFLTWILIIGAMFPHVIESWRILERSSIGYMPPIYPYKTWILAGTILMTLQGVNVFIKELYRLFNGKELKLS